MAPMEGAGATGRNEVPAERNAVPGVEVVIVTFGRSELVRRCLLSLRRALASVGPAEVHVVDNCSPDDTAEVVAREFPEVHLHRQATNSGFSAANNVVLRTARHDYVLLLNPDTEVPAGVLDHLLVRMEEDPSIGVLGCRLVLLNGTFDHAAKRSIPRLADAARYFASRVLPGITSRYRAPEVAELETGDVDAVNGAFMLIRRQALQEVGCLDERYWMYAEDLDLCVRMRRAGWRVVYDGTVSAVHVKAASSGAARSARLNWHFHRSMVIFYRQHLAGERPIEDLVSYAAILARLAAVVPRDLIVRAVRRVGKVT